MADSNYCVRLQAATYYICYTDWQINKLSMLVVAVRN